MNVIAFVLLAGMLTAYAVLDGYDLGVGAVLYVFGRTRAERADAMATIAPFWNGNEVWLIAAGGTLFALFPRAYAVSFSGFYLPLMIALWLFMGRGIAFELRNHFASELWQDFWDVVFALSSAGLAIVFGVALGNLIRGLPLDAGGYFLGSFSLLLNPYALGVGVLALIALAYHGLTYLYMSAPPARETLRTTVRRLWWLLVVAYVGVTVATAFVHPLGNQARLAAAAAFILSALALLASATLTARGKFRASFRASSAFIALLVASAAGTIFPYLVPTYGGAPGGVSVFDTSPSSGTLAVIIAVLVVGLAAAVAYALFAARRLTREGVSDNMPHRP